MENIKKQNKTNCDAWFKKACLLLAFDIIILIHTINLLPLIYFYSEYLATHRNAT